MAEEIGLILNLITQLLPMLKPSELSKVKKEIEKTEKEISERRHRLLKAIKEQDVEAINKILFEEF